MVRKQVAGVLLGLEPGEESLAASSLSADCAAQELHLFRNQKHQMNCHHPASAAVLQPYGYGEGHGHGQPAGEAGALAEEESAQRDHDQR